MFARAAAVVVLGTSSIAGAQGATSAAKPYSFGISAGASVPTGDLRSNFNTGYNLGAHVAVAAPSLPISFRADAGYDNWGSNSANLTNLHAWSATGNVVLTVPTGTTMTPYLIGGVGAYSFGGAELQSSGFVNTNSGLSQSDTHFGYNAGGGITIPLSGFNTFVEARYNHVSITNGSYAFVPIRFGVMF